MKAEELRIGNLVYNSHGDIHAIGCNCFHRFRHPSMDGNPSGFKPIPLTEEILLKCEFENEIDDIDGKMYNIYFVTNTDYLIEYFHSDKKYVFTDDMGLKVNIKYLHQLQNLYYALCGEELEVHL